MIEAQIMYQVVDLFMAGVPVSEIATSIKKTSLDIMTILQGDDARLYTDKLRELRRMELEALSDGPALDAVRDGLNSNIGKDRLQAADMTWKASGKYQQEEHATVTLAKLLEKVMGDARDKKDV